PFGHVFPHFSHARSAARILRLHALLRRGHVGIAGEREQKKADHPMLHRWFSQGLVWRCRDDDGGDAKQTATKSRSRRVAVNVARLLFTPAPPPAAPAGRCTSSR